MARSNVGIGDGDGSAFLLEDAAQESVSAVEYATARICNLILRRELHPEQQLRQEELAESLGLSRGPIREALKALHSQGLVTHSRNQGYFVKLVTADEMKQIYLMRRLLETELLRSLEWPDARVLQVLRRLHAQMSARRSPALGELIRLNREFHFRILQLSPLELVLREVRRLWLLSDSYRALYVFDEGASEAMCAVHESILEALRNHDRAGLLAVTDDHRHNAERRVVDMLQG
jgi:DNA-binding GntR family transcriptional regulator